MVNSDTYSIPIEAERLFQDGILGNDLIKPNLPAGAIEAARLITFDGSSSPSIPVNWRFAESVSALKAYEATILLILLKNKYGLEPSGIKINTDHAQLFIMSALLWAIDPDGENLTPASMMRAEGRQRLAKLFPDFDRHGSSASLYRASATNIYQCKDLRYFHIHGSMNPDPTLEALELPLHKQALTVDEALKPFHDKISTMTSDQLDHIIATDYSQAGTTCHTKEEYLNSEHGKANAHVGLFGIHARPNPAQKPCWWPDAPSTSSRRPLSGLKVVDLTRVIAAPAITRGLAELGASVMRITANHLDDISSLHLDLNHGKWNAFLDLNQQHDRERLRTLIEEADVFVQGYRPGALDKYGFSQEDVLQMVQKRGLIYVRENCYGWNGPFSTRPGWQQISDASCGVSMEFGRAMGNDEPVTPIFPNSDYCTGIVGTTAILTALIRRAKEGGSFTVDLALNYYSQWLINSVGVYPRAVWEDLWQRSGKPVFRHYQNIASTIPKVMGILMTKSASTLFRPNFFAKYEVKNLGKMVKIVAPVLQFPGGEVELGYQVGTRTNGVDQPFWPHDLMVEIVV